MSRFHIKKINESNFTYVTAKVSNPFNPAKSMKLDFLIDTGAAGCALPKDVADALGLQEKGVVDVGLADGRSVKASASYILIEINNKKVYTWTIFGEGFEPIIGVDVMKILKLHVDVTEKQALVPLRSFRINPPMVMNNNFNMNVECKGE
ncbi:MAG: clan AA aspartic protease [Archaeoglobaceae archaeon]